MRVSNNKPSLISKYRENLKDNNKVYLILFNMLLVVSGIFQIIFYVVLRDGLRDDTDELEQTKYYV